MRSLVLAGALACAVSVRSAADTIPSPVYDGSRGELSVVVPRIEDAAVRIDGRLDEEVWAQAAVLTGFTQYRPAEGAPASERTEVLLFYTPGDLYVGIRAHATDPSRIRATLAERDRITADDHVRIFLDTFHDRRRAFAFYVNPLGIQQDGMHADGRTSFSPDFIFHSRGRLTESGYEVEIRIPLKSIKFPSDEVQTWGINVARVIPATGAEASWAPRARNEAAELERAGRLTGIHGLRPGRLLEVNPVLTARRDGFVRDGVFQRGPVEPDAGVNLKYGVTSELTLDATINPDFSQVEADADQITVNERFAVSLAEKRPFFLEGADLFSTMERLVYTRSIVSPVVGARITGKAGPVNVAYLGAVDDAPLNAPARYAPSPERATVHVGRVLRDFGAGGSTLGALATLRETGGAFNRVAAGDARVRFGEWYTAGVQAGASWTRRWVQDPLGTDSAGSDGGREAVATDDLAGHVAHLFLDRTARHWGYVVTLRDVGDDFRTETGFIRRTGITDISGGNRLSWYGAPGAWLERVDLRAGGGQVYAGRDLWKGRAPLEGSLSARVGGEFRGNHEAQVWWSRGFFTLDPASYARYSVPGPDGVVETGDVLVASGRRMRGLDGFGVEVGSAYFRTIRWEASASSRETPIFPEGTRGREVSLRGEVALRPTDALRVDASLRRARLYRQRDGSRYSDALVPRLRVEYQVSRAVALRALTQYAVEEVDLLRTPDGRAYLRDGEPFRVRRGATPLWDRPQLNPLRTDLLFSYRPSPGTVVFLGYGREVLDDEAFRFGDLAPRSDGVFFKVSYLFRN